jgi:hypothetical protein
LGLAVAGHGAHLSVERLRGGGGGLSHACAWPNGAVAVRLRRAAAALRASAGGRSTAAAGVAAAEAEGVAGDDAALCAALRGGPAAARLLAWWTPAAAVVAPLATSKCSWCRKGFVYVEAEHFAKFSFEYCRAKCLRAHREAGFAEPIAV